MKTSELEFDLPEALVAQRPAEPRDAARLLILDRATGELAETTFAHLPDYLNAGDCLVFNDTKVIRARLFGAKPTGGKVEIFLLREVEPGAWEALVRPSAKVKPGTAVALPEGLEALVEDVLPEGKRLVRFAAPDFMERLESAGHIPLPPYIAREDESHDAERYQTIYARASGAVAAPTAGLHYTEDLLRRLDAKGVRRAYLTLHVGYGTFKPVTAETLEEHTVDPETYALPRETAELLNRTRAEGGRIVAVGTTATRTLESCVSDGLYQPGSGETRLYIHPPYTFQGVDALQTNFHLPKSSLLALVAAFAGTGRVLNAYREAVDRGFRFYSYGDSMLIR